MQLPKATRCHAQPHCTAVHSSTAPCVVHSREKSQQSSATHLPSKAMTLVLVVYVLEELVLETVRFDLSHVHDHGHAGHPAHHLYITPVYIYNCHTPSYIVAQCCAASHSGNISQRRTVWHSVVQRCTASHSVSQRRIASHSIAHIPTASHCIAQNRTGSAAHPHTQHLLEHTGIDSARKPHYYLQAPLLLQPAGALVHHAAILSNQNNIMAATLQKYIATPLPYFSRRITAQHGAAGRSTAQHGA